MRILALSDTHGQLGGISLAEVDVAFFAGDVAPLKGRGPWHVYDQVKWMNGPFAKWCFSWPECRIIVVPGNHDFFPIAKERFGDKLSGKDLSLRLPENATMLVDSETVVESRDGGKLHVYGTPWVPIISHSWAFEAEHDRLKEKFSKIPEGLDVLVTHGPPRNGNMDVSMQWGAAGERYGSSELLEAVAEKKPKMLFCGHIHSGDHGLNDIYGTKAWNVSRVDERYEIAYAPVAMEV